mmetsp:Transcript_11938/g.31569  ORF Transcript_11938/g.31569 Transcript_11938/m.31569 type:complete len:231 (-) Transcript_11938:90-782(-)
MMPRRTKFGEPAPLFLGSLPLELGVQVICTIHTLFCIFFVAGASSVVTADFGFFEVGPELQVALSAWHLLGVMLIAGTLVGTAWRQDWPLQAYFYYLVCCFAAACFVVVKIFQVAGDCSIVSAAGHQSQRVGVDFSCGMVASLYELTGLAGLMCVGYAAFIVWQLKEHILESEHAQHLLAHESSLAKRLRAAQYVGGNKSPHEAAAFASYVSPSQGLQPAWGSVTIRSTG